MKTSFKFLLVLLLLSQGWALTVSHNYNFSKVHELSLISQPLFLPTNPVPTAQRQFHTPSLLQYSLLKKYQLRDIDYRPEQQSLSAQDQLLLFNTEPPPGIFSHQLIHIENYRLLQMRKFKVEMKNPSDRFKLTITQITTDRNEVRRDDERGALPVTLHPAATHDFNFVFYASWLNPQFLQSMIYFVVQIYDGNVLADEKVYARKVATTIIPNHLRLTNHVFNNCPRYHTITIKNYEIHDIGIVLEGKKRFETVEGIQLDGQTRLQPTKYLKLLVEGKPTQMLIHTITGRGNPVLPTLLLQVMCIDPVTIDYFNIGIIPDQRTVYQFPLTVSSAHHQNMTIEQVVVDSTSQAVLFQEDKYFKGVVTHHAKNMQIGLLRVFSRKVPEKKSIVQVKMKIKGPHQEFWTQQRFIYQEIRNPIAAGKKRFIDLRKVSPNKQRFTLKNSLNLPLFLTHFYCDQKVIQLSWTGQRRKIVYPNLSIQQLSFVYIGPTQIPLSPQKHIILLQFNGNIIVPIEIVVFDHTLQCLLDNQEYKCSNIQNIDFGYLRDQRTKGRQLIVRNWNPEALPFNIQTPVELSKQNGINMQVDIYGPLPSDGQSTKKDKTQKDFILKPNHFLVINLEVELMYNGTSINFPLAMTTPLQSINIPIVIRVENGTIALIPQVVRFQAPVSRTIQYLNLVSTYSQQYKIVNVSTNYSNIIVAIPAHDDLQGNQFVGMTVVYQPYLRETNITGGDWSSAKKQFEYHLFRMKKQYEQSIYVQIKLTTSTELQAKSTIIIDKNYPPLVLESAPLIAGEGTRYMKYILPKRKSRNPRYGQQRQIYQFNFVVTNPFPFPLKYRPFLVSDIKYALIQHYFRHYRVIKEQRMGQVFFCISQALKSKNRLTPSAVKDIFQLGILPDEFFLDVSLNQNGDTEMLMRPKNPKNRTFSVPPRTSDFQFLLHQDKNLYRTCYFFTSHQLIAGLLITKLPYQILEEEGERVFREFIRAQIHNIKHMGFFQSESNLHMRTRQHYYQYCWESPQFIVYRFCDSLHAKIHSAYQNGEKVAEIKDRSYVLAPLKSHTVTVQISNPTDTAKFFMVLANNFTKFQTYQVELQIKKPKLFIRYDDLSPIFNDYSEEIDLWGQEKGASLLPIQLFREDYHPRETFIAGRRVFQVVNDGQGPLYIDHIGIDEKEFSCGQKGIEISGLTCKTDPKVADFYKNRNMEGKVTLLSQSRHNLTVDFFLNLKSWPAGKKPLLSNNKKFLKYSIYLYDLKKYYFKLQLVFRIADPILESEIAQFTASQNSHKMYAYIGISTCSFIIISIFLLRIRDEQNNPVFKIIQEREKAEEDQYKRIHRIRRLSRILKEPNSYDPAILIGAKLNKRANEKPVHKVTEDLLLSAKQVTQRELKKYFNQSQQSAIGAILDLNHHLSLSHSMSDHEIAQEPQTITNSQDQPEQQVSQKSSDLPEGEEVELTQELDEDSWYDFNTSNNRSARNNNSTIQQQPEREEQQFYNVFRTDVGLKNPSNNNLLGPNQFIHKRKHS